MQFKPERSIALVAILVLSACDAPQKTSDFSGQVMGTSYAVQLVDLPSKTDEEDLDSRIAAVLNGVDGAMSTYKPKSEVSRFNDATSGVSVDVSVDTLQVVELALTIHKQSQGAFDITVGPLVDVWGFGADMRELKAATDTVCHTASVGKSGR